MSSRKAVKKDLRTPSETLRLGNVNSPSTPAQPAPTALGGSPRRSTAPWWIKVFVLFHIVAITVWAIPPPPAKELSGEAAPIGTDWVLVENDRYMKKFAPLVAYISVLGFWQYWDMFAPDPANADWYCDAVVTYKDGHTERYQYPRIFLLPIPEKLIKERYRKFFERARSETQDYIFPPFAERIAYLMDHHPGDPPVQVDVYRHILIVAPPGHKQSTTYSSECYYKHIVDQALLQRDKQGLP